MRQAGRRIYPRIAAFKDAEDAADAVHTGHTICKVGSSFVPGTHVQTADGTIQTIEDLESGMRSWPRPGKRVSRAVSGGTLMIECHLRFCVGLTAVVGPEWPHHTSERCREADVPSDTD